VVTRVGASNLDHEEGAAPSVLRRCDSS
jgi:hypothetical protein